MILCEHDCKPCCDFCYYSIHRFYKMDNGEIIKSEPIGCQLHTDEEHQQLAEACSSCDDFYCNNAFFKHTQELREKMKNN